MVAETETGNDPEGATVPITWSMVAVVASVDDHERSVVPPPTGSVSGTAVNVPVGGGGSGTNTLCETCRVPPAPVNVRVKVVVAGTVTCVEPEEATGPMPLSIEAEVALVDDQDRVVLPPPTASVSELAVNVPVGGGGRGTNTESESRLVPPLPSSINLYVVVSVTLICIVPAESTRQMPWSMTADVSYVDDHARSVSPPPTGSVSGTAVNVPVGGGGRGTNTHRESCVVPPLPVNVR